MFVFKKKAEIILKWFSSTVSQVSLLTRIPSSSSISPWLFSIISIVWYAQQLLSFLKLLLLLLTCENIGEMPNKQMPVPGLMNKYLLQAPGGIKRCTEGVCMEAWAVKGFRNKQTWLTLEEEWGLQWTKDRFGLRVSATCVPFPTSFKPSQ